VTDNMTLYQNIARLMPQDLASAFALQSVAAARLRQIARHLTTVVRGTPSFAANPGSGGRFRSMG
jgi:hypothetical protein